VVNDIQIRPGVRGGLLDRILLARRCGGTCQGDGVAVDREIEIGDRRAVLENRSCIREIECIDIGVDLDLVDDVDP
jgi:hypothetical protein